MLLILILTILGIQETSAVKYYFYNNGDDLGVSYNVDKKRSDIGCVITPSNPSVREISYEVSKEVLNRIKKHCVENTLDSGSTRVKRGINILAPGTKWCGTGNVGKNDNDLGSNAVTDACCRDHDRCLPKVEGFSDKGDYFFNYLPWTRLHCDCDTIFYDCLKEAKNKEKDTANLVGKIYFNILDTKCFVETQKKVCTKYSWFQCTKHKTVDTYKWVSNKSF